MANNRYFDFIEIEYNKLTDQINQWLRYKYNKADIQFNSASPYGHIINVLKELFLQNLLYLKNSFKILDIKTSTNKKVIQQTSRIAGHSPSRAISSTGTLNFKLKPGIDYQKDIQGGIIKIENKASFKNISNNLKYSANLNSDTNIFSINIPGSMFSIPVIQGSYETQIFTGNGTINQSYSVNIPNSKQIENFNYDVYYNSIKLEKKTHLWDLLPKEYSYYTKSGFNGGLDIYFGTDNYGFVPQQGSQIKIEYLLSDGSIGDILNPTINDWKIESNVIDGGGNTIELNKLFDISIQNEISFSSDGETIEFTKAITPYISRNFVLSTPPQFIFHLKRMNIFSKVNAFNMLNDNDITVTESVVTNYVTKIENAVSKNKTNDEILATVNNFKKVYNKYTTNMNDNTIYLYLIPDITKYFNDDVNYFNIDYGVFYLDKDEQQKTLSFLKMLGTTTMTSTIKIIQPKISKYVMHVYIRRLSDSNEDNIKNQIITLSSEYLLKNNRFDRIPKSDFIKIFKSIDGVDSVSLYFVSEKNENYHRKNNTTRQTTQPNKIINGIIQSSYNSNILMGIDNVHGDIIIEKDEYAIIRGGFRDRGGIWYSENPNNNTLNSINVFFDGITKK